MQKRKLTLLVFLFAAVFANAQGRVSIKSPDQLMSLTVKNDIGGNITYEVAYKTKTVVAPSSLGFSFKEPALQVTSFDILSIDSTVVDKSWEPVWGETKLIRDNYKQLVLRLASHTKDRILLNIFFRAYNDGIAFRYEFPEQKGLMHFIIGDELTGFAMTGDHQSFWIPGDYDTNEYSYNHTSISRINAMVGDEAKEINVRSLFDSNAVQTPLMMKTAEGIYINIHEAALSNYPAMNLVLDKKKFNFNARLVPDAVGNKAYLQTPAKTPWRTILISDNAATLLASKMVLNCNEPSKISNTSFVKPQKFVGVWWEMHVGKSSWDYSGGQVGSQQQSKVPHGANTANVKRYIDFASSNGFDGVLVEGWNTGWEDWFGKWKEDVFDFLTPYPDYDLEALTAYAKQKNVRIIMHHETSGSVTNYERYMDRAYALMKSHNMNSVKSGYVGRIIPRGEHHDGQWMVKHYERVAKTTGENGIMVDMHEPVRPTGMHRTYPNWLACEAARGNEFNAWSVGNPPDHETILPFTRLIGGPMDYTPGIFRIKMSYYNPGKKEQIHTTLCKQLALYVTMYSPLQMAADLPENYEQKPDAFQFIKDVAVDWDDTKILAAEPGDYIYIARKEKGKANWFVGGITDENSREFVLKTDFLEKGTSYLAKVYRDAPDADWKTNPEAYVIEKFIVDNRTAMKLRLAPGGGFAVSLMPATKADISSTPKYRNK